MADRDMQLAREESAPNEHAAYISAATEAAEIVGSLTGNKIDTLLVSNRNYLYLTSE